VGAWLRRGGESDEDVYEVLIIDDSLRKLLPDLVILIEIEGVQELETAACEGGLSLRTQILTAQRYSMGDSLLACLMMICSNWPIVGSAGALEAVGDYEAHPTVMLEDVPQDIVFKTLKGSCACVAVLVFVYVCVLVRATQMAVIGFIFTNSSAVVKEF